MSLRSNRIEDGPATLLIRAKAPGPIFDLNAYFLPGGRPVHFVGERWRKEDAAHCLAATYPDPQNPDQIIAYRLVDGRTGEVIPSVSCEEYLKALAVSRRAGLGSRQRARGLRRG